MTILNIKDSMMGAIDIIEETLLDVYRIAIAEDLIEEQEIESVPAEPIVIIHEQSR